MSTFLVDILNGQDQVFKNMNCSTREKLTFLH